MFVIVSPDEDFVVIFTVEPPFDVVPRVVFALCKGGGLKLLFPEFVGVLEFALALNLAKILLWFVVAALLLLLGFVVLLAFEAVPTGLVVLLMLVLFCITLLICRLWGVVFDLAFAFTAALFGTEFFTAVNDILGDISFNCLDMLVVPGGEDVGIICISEVEPLDEFLG